MKRDIPHRRFGLVVALATVALGLSPALTLAQSSGSGFSLKSDPAFLKLFRDSIARVSESIVRIRSENEDVALGIIITSDGFILSKASLLGRDNLCVLSTGREVKCRVHAVHEQHDLAVLKTEVKNLKAVNWSLAKNATAGAWVAAAGSQVDPLAVGVISVGVRTLNARELAFESSIPQGGYLGIQMEPIEKDAGVRVTQVMPGTAASKAGMKEDDIVIRIGETLIDKRERVFEVLSKTRPGDTILLRVKRGDEVIKIEVLLGKRPATERADFQNAMGSTLSQRRAGFPTVLQHDTVIRPQDCGGPLIDLDGKVLGINIARSGRVESLTIPSETVVGLLKELQAGKSTPPSAIQRYLPITDEKTGGSLGNINDR